MLCLLVLPRGLLGQGADLQIGFKVLGPPLGFNVMVGVLKGTAARRQDEEEGEEDT